jgi:hypothetical protein
MCVKVAWLTVADNLAQVGFVALDALRDLSVDVMTLGTVKGRMLALIVRELQTLRPVAG